MKYEAHESIRETLALPRMQFIDRCKAWLKEFHDGKLLKLDRPMQCPVAQWVAHNDAKCHRQMVPTTTVCPICGNPVCPDCMNHNVEIISRVTGYLSTVSGWNEAKKQEFEDRNRYNHNGE